MNPHKNWKNQFKEISVFEKLINFLKGIQLFKIIDKNLNSFFKVGDVNL